MRSLVPDLMAKGFASLAIVGLLAPSVSAQTYRDALVQSPSLAPPGRGSVAGPLASLRYGPTDLARGSFQLPSPFSTPTDRGPMLAPVFPGYSPDGGLSEWGMGWNSDLSIRRFRTLGTLDYANDELLSPWGRLVEGTDGALYPAGMEDRVRVVASAGGFVATLPDGTRWVFGSGDAITNSQGTYAWHVSEIESVQGDRTEIVWETNPSGRRFVSEVRWGGRGAVREMRARVTYDAVPTPIADFASSERLLLDRRVQRVDVEARDHASGTWQNRWAYELEYTESIAGVAFYLSSVTRIFPSGEADPAVTYEYALPEERLSTTALEPMPELADYLAMVGGTGIQPEVVSFFDLEDDGRLDMEHRYDQSLVHHTDAGWVWEGAPPRDGTEHPLCRPAPSHYNKPRMLVRMTPDADEPEVVVAYRSGASTGIVICDRQGHQLTQQAVSGAWDLGANTRLVDIDRDLRPDFVRVFQGGYEVLRNTSDAGGYSFERLAAKALSPAFTPTATWVQDINGDGLVDLVARSTTAVVVWFGLGGNRFQPTGTAYTFLSNTGPVTNLGLFQITFTDANHDGLADALLTQGRYVTLFTNRGTHFQQITVPGFESITWTVGLPVAADLDGHGEEQVVLVNGINAHRITLSAPEAGLLVRADDGRGGAAAFEYRRARPTPGIERRPPMLTRMEVTATGGGTVAFTYDYEDAAFHPTAHYLLGFGTVRRDSPNAVESADFHFDADVSGLLLGTRTAGDETDVYRFDVRQYDEATFRGVRLLRLRDRSAGWADASGEQVDGTTTAHVAYDELCATEIRSTSRHGELLAVTELDPLPALGDALHCTPRKIRNIGTHTGRPELDFDYLAQIDRNPIGMLTRMTAIAGAEQLVLQEVEYDALYRVAAISTPSEGRTEMAYDPGTGLLESITAPDGVITRVERDPRTDALASLLLDRGPGASWTRSFQYDGVERLEATWDDVGASSAALPDTTYQYRYADATRPAAIVTRSLVDGAASIFTDTVELQAATGAALATSVPTTSGWAFDGLAVSDPSAARTDRYHRAPIGVDPLSLTVADLLDPSARTPLAHRIDSVFGHAVEESATIRSGVTRTTGARLSIASGTLVAEALENGVVRRTALSDGEGRVVESRDALGAITQMQYDALGRLVEVALPGGDQQRVHYDAFGRVARVDRTGIGSSVHTYDAQGRMATTRYLDSAGTEIRKLTMSYDAIGRVTEERHRRASDGVEVAYTFQYDGGPNGDAVQRGHLTSVAGPGFVRSMRYRRDGKIEQSRLDFPGFRSIVVDRTYAEDGSDLGATRTVYSFGGQVLLRSEQRTEYDSLGRSWRKYLDDELLYELSYDDEGRASHVTFADGEVLVMRFDPLTHGVIGYDHVAGDWAVGVEVERNDRGLVSAERIELTSGTAAPVVHDREYEYDARGFLTERRGPDGNSAYTYGANNRLSSASDLAGARQYTRTGSTATVGGVTYTYDAAGRVIGRDGTALVYGAHGQVEQVNDGQRTFWYLYDEGGQRIAKMEGASVVAVYVDGAYITDTTVVEPVRVAGHLVGVLWNGAYRSVATDPRGTVLTEDDGTFVDASPYGNRISRTDLAPALDYVEQAYDEHLGIIRMGVRDYDPVLGEFLTPDPLYFADAQRCASDPVQCTLYAYAGNDPVGYVDPTGLERQKEIDFKAIPVEGRSEPTMVTEDTAISGTVALGVGDHIYDMSDHVDNAHLGGDAYNSLRDFAYVSGYGPGASWNSLRLYSVEPFAIWNPQTLAYEHYIEHGPRQQMGQAELYALAAFFETATNNGYPGQQYLANSGISVKLELRDAYQLSDAADHTINVTTTTNAGNQSGNTRTRSGTIKQGPITIGGSTGSSQGQNTGRGGGRSQTIPVRARAVVGTLVMTLERREGNKTWRAVVNLGNRQVFQNGAPGRF